MKAFIKCAWISGVINMTNFLKNNCFKIGLLVSIILLVGAFVDYRKADAYGECSQYGIMAYESLGSCKCMSGYVFKDDIFGNSTCVSGSSVCYDKYGYGSQYDSLSGSCECSYGYVLGKDSIGRTQCISENQACQNQYGFNSRSTFGGKCECSYGYVFNNSNQCEYGNTVCSRKHGIYASYDSLSNSCECDSGYTLDDDNQCVKKQNNVYFTVKELDTDNKQAIIKSDYDFSYYLITYNSGCYASSFRRYLNHQIVVNLGTDFYLDTWDKIVLQDDDETCDITRKEKVDSSFSLEPEEEEFFYTPPPAPVIVPSKVINTTPTPKVESKPLVAPEDKKVQSKDTVKIEEVKKDTTAQTAPEIEKSNEAETNNIPKIPWYKRFFSWLF